MRLFFDANVLFTAAHNPKGKAALVITLGQNGLWQMATSAYAIDEARRNLQRKYPGSLPAFEALLVAIRIVQDAQETACPDGLVEKDCPIYRAACACQADVLLTGDIKDFGFLMNKPAMTGGMRIQTVAEYLANA